MLSAWRETSFYTDRERAALAWNEAVTSIASGRVPDDVFAAARAAYPLVREDVWVQIAQSVIPGYRVTVEGLYDLARMIEPPPMRTPSEPASARSICTSSSGFCPRVDRPMSTAPGTWRTSVSA